ncbi:MAG: MerR family transcriptional regulator [Propionibacteriaceae bacterium]|jgi:DNA-binding transcriptional MerR regulator|nr:MerR family transcriptional regulator [Propionibacteriaceae bacterium]
MAAQGLSIGKVQELLRPEFGDVAISKIRFLETSGLITPERLPSGFRRYSKADVERLRYILNAQRDNFLPLKVIKENLDLIDQGIEPVMPEPVEPPRAAHLQPEPSIGGPRPQMRLTRDELLARSGLTEATLVELERQGIIRLRRGTAHYGWEAFTLAVVASRFAPWGIDARQMRILKIAADREVELIQYAVAPYNHRPERARQAIYEVAEFMMQAHAALLQVALDNARDA